MALWPWLELKTKPTHSTPPCQAIHGGAVAAHAILVFWIFGYWILYSCSPWISEVEHEHDTSRHVSQHEFRIRTKSLCHQVPNANVHRDRNSHQLDAGDANPGLLRFIALGRKEQTTVSTLGLPSIDLSLCQLRPSTGVFRPPAKIGVFDRRLSAFRANSWDKTLTTQPSL